jgi:hypothetical protein
VNSGGDDATERSEVGVGDGGRDWGGMDMMTRLRKVRMTCSRDMQRVRSMVWSVHNVFLVGKRQTVG